MLKTTPFSSQSSLRIIFFFFFFTILHSHRVQPQADISTNAENTILLKLKQQWLNPRFLEDHWIPSHDHCTWPGINCINGLVTEIKITYEGGINQKIPPLICDLKNLIHIDLHSNLIPGPFPTYLYNCSKLKYLDLSGNSFMGSIPENIVRALSPHLKYLNLRNNNFYGGIPTAFGNMTTLEHLDLSENFLNGNIPNDLFQLKNLRFLYLSQNNFSGSLPRSVEALNLEEIRMPINNLRGTIPDDFGKLEKLRTLDLFSNQLSGQFPTLLTALPSLSYMDIGRNIFSGRIPPEIGSLSNLSRLYLCCNNFSGKIPPEIGRLATLRDLHLLRNKFSGKIPSQIGRLSSLRDLDLSHNKFSGKIPPQIGHLSSLRDLDLSHNKFLGDIPPQLQHLSSLRDLDLSYNKFSGKIPPQIGHLSSLETLDLSDNEFSGKIPPEIGSLSSLQFLDLSDNKFSHKIPLEIGSSSSLQYLDLSNNKFSGKIPPEIWLPSLRFVNLSSNLLCGSIPPKFKYSSSGTYISGHPNRCNPPFAAIFSGAAIAILLIMIFIFYVLRRYKLTWYKLDSTWKLIPFQKLDFTESTILSSLSENNSIGCGGSGNVYRVQVNSSGEYVAVKRILNNKKMDKRLEKQFRSEVQILGTIRHLNILKLMCCISSQNSKFLVYEYMENGSLHQWLHCKRIPSTISCSLSLQNVVLEWPKRLQIAIGAAQGLCYMHHCSSSPIIHRDLKSSNILLDSEFNAKIADFGLARILECDRDPSTMSVVAGTVGYIAPEYAQTTRVNEKADVYSFGVILLELVTGRKAHQGDENSSLVEWAWRHIQQENPIVDALDEKVKGPNYLDEMIKVFKLGICCTHMVPLNRPTMMEIQQILHLCAHPSAPEENTLVPVPINSVPLTRTIVFSLRTFTEVSKL